jgi:hypothetical protein
MELSGADNKDLSMTRGDSESITINGLGLVNGDIIYLTVKEHIKYSISKESN